MAEALEKIHDQVSGPTTGESGPSVGVSGSSAEEERAAYGDIEVADIDELKRIVYEDSDAARRLAALEKFISGTEPVEVLVLSEFASKSFDPILRGRAIERLIERGNQGPAIFIIQGELDETDPGEKWFGELTPEQRIWAAESIIALGG